VLGLVAAEHMTLDGELRVTAANAHYDGVP
jgi:hypothetical protein